MNGQDTDRGLTSPTTNSRHFGSRLLVLLLIIPTGLLQSTSAQPDIALAQNRAPLAAVQVGAKPRPDEPSSSAGASRLSGAAEPIEVEYRGFPGNRVAGMVVNVKYVSGKKQFVIESSTGSGLIVDRVLKKLLEAEAEATDEEGSVTPL